MGRLVEREIRALLAVAVGLVVLVLVYSHTSRLNGWSESELLVVLGIQILLQFLKRIGLGEEAFSIEIPDEDTEQIKTVKDAIEYIKAHANA